MRSGISMVGRKAQIGRCIHGIVPCYSNYASLWMDPAHDIKYESILRSQLLRLMLFNSKESQFWRKLKSVFRIKIIRILWREKSVSVHHQNEEGIGQRGSPNSSRVSIHHQSFPRECIRTFFPGRSVKSRQVPRLTWEVQQMGWWNWLG